MYIKSSVNWIFFYTFVIFQDGRHSISIILFLIVFNMAIGISTVPLFTKFHVNSLSITIAMTV